MNARTAASVADLCMRVVALFILQITEQQCSLVLYKSCYSNQALAATRINDHAPYLMVVSSPLL